jgi:hypothetical protein
MNPIRWNNLEVKADVFYVWSFRTPITGKGIGFIDFESVKFVSGVGFHSNPEFYLGLNQENLDNTTVSGFL